MAMRSTLRGKLPPLPLHLRSVLTPPRVNSGRPASADALPCAKLGTSFAPAPHPSGSAGQDGWDAGDKMGIMLGDTASAPASPKHAAAEGLHAALQQQAALLRPAAAAPKQQAWPPHTDDMGKYVHVHATEEGGMALVHASGRHIVL